MKRNIQLISLLIIILTMGGCAQKKSVFKKPNVTKEDFYYATIDSLQKWDAVILDENTSMQVQKINPELWVISKERKILILSDDSNNKEIGVIDYFNPFYSTINTLGTMNMLLYTFNKNGKIKHRKVTEHEIIQTRLNDSITQIQLNFKNNVAGKILVQQYKSLVPTIEAKFQQMGPLPAIIDVLQYIFQDTVPLLSGKCEVFIPKYLYENEFNFINEFIKLGNGEIEIRNENTKAFYYSDYSGYNFPSSDKDYFDEKDRLKAGYWKEPRLLSDSRKQVKKQRKVEYEALKVTATVTNVMPLSNKSVEQPLGIQILLKPIRK